MWPRTNVNTTVNQRCYITFNRKSQGQSHRERLQIWISHPSLYPCRYRICYSLMWPRTNLNTEVNQIYYVTLNKKSQGQVIGKGYRLRDLIQVYSLARYQSPLLFICWRCSLGRVLVRISFYLMFVFLVEFLGTVGITGPSWIALFIVF